MANQVIKDCGFHHIALSASDFEKSLKFYTEGLGYTVYRSWETETGRKIAMLDFGNGTLLELFSDGKRENVPEEPAGSYFHLALKTSDTKAAFESALKAGGTVHKAPSECVIPSCPEIKAVIGFVKGPDGELIELFEQK